LFLLFRLFLLRLAERQLLSLLFHEPPRNTAVGAIPRAKIDFTPFSKKIFSASPNPPPHDPQGGLWPPKKKRKKEKAQRVKG
jgi:hypothetical protein